MRDIDKRKYKILEYIYDHKQIEEKEIYKHFNDNNVGKIIADLASDFYLICQNANTSERYEFEKEDNDYILAYGKDKSTWDRRWSTYSPTNVIIETKRLNTLMWTIPLSISALSLLISFLNMCYNMHNVFYPTAIPTPIPIQIILTTPPPTQSIPPMYPFIP